MSLPSFSTKASAVQSVKPVGANGWLITFQAERTSPRARHGRARWSLSAGLRRRLASLR